MEQEQTSILETPMMETLSETSKYYNICYVWNQQIWLLSLVCCFIYELRVYSLNSLRLKTAKFSLD